MANSIIHFLLFELFFSLFESGLDLRLRIAGSLSRGLPPFGAVSLPRGLPSFEERCFRLLQGGGVIFSNVDVERGMLEYVLDILGPGKLGIRGQLMGQSL